MNKYVFVPLFIMTCCAKVNATSQLQTLIEINLKNLCPHAIDVTVSEVTTYVENSALLYQPLPPNEIINIRSCLYLNEANKNIVNECLPDNYTLQINADIYSKRLNKTQLLELLETADYKEYGGGGFWIWKTGVKYEWTISDPSLCPK